MSSTASIDDRVTDLASRVAGPVYSPALVGGLLLQVVALLVASVWLSLAGLLMAALVEVATVRDVHEVRVRLRRVGLGIVQRTTLRAVLFVSALGAAGTGGHLTFVVYAAMILLMAATARIFQRLLSLVAEMEPALGVRNLGERLELRTFFSRTRRRRGLGVGLVCAVEVPAALLTTLHATELIGSVVFLPISAIVIVGIVGFLGISLRWSRRFRRSGRRERYLEAIQEELRRLSPRTMLYFSGGADATYQLNQWIPVLERLDEPVLILIRERGHLAQMLETRHPVLLCPRVLDVEVALAADPAVVLYVGNAGRNIHFLRYARPKHVFLNHGDSDKVSSANRFVHAYDRLFVAGEIAIERYRAAGIHLSDDWFEVVGRPQLDRVLDQRRRLGDGPTTVLYAPTWEGYFDAADYSSLGRMGEDLIRRLLRDHPELRVVFKPHPMSGIVRREDGAAAKRVERLLRDAGAPHVLAADRPDLDLLDWFDRSDLLIADISAVVTDFLHTDKPYLVTNPRGLTHQEFHARFPSHGGAYVLDPDLGSLGEHLSKAVGGDPLAARRAEVKQQVLGYHPDGPMASFQRALEDAILWAEQDAARVRNTFSYD
jgi:hypothetical protein